jgi:gamma-glutamyltranspeptidase/glutathione hydrolase
MRIFSQRLIGGAVLVLGTLIQVPATGQATSDRGAVATVHPAATRAGLAVLAEGGNAVDAAIAAALTLGVVDCHNSGIGGGCFILLRVPDGKLIAIDGRETAPKRANPQRYLQGGKFQPERSQVGPLAVGTPGALAAYAYVVKQFGKMPLKKLLLPAAEIADKGFRIDPTFAARLSAEAETLARFEGSRAALLRTDGTPYRQGDLLQFPDLARTYREIARAGTDWFYRGPFAKRVETWMQQHGGVLAAEDFGNYRVARRQPVVSSYRGRTIVGFPPPSSGGVHVAEILNILENFDLQAASESQLVHLTAEAMKLAFADRAFWLGDPGFTKVPRGLIEKSYARQLARDKINPDRVTKVTRHGIPPGAEENVFGKHTTHIAVADTEGYWVALTTTVNTPFGSKVIVPGTGVVLNNQMDDFSIQVGAPNAFGLIGAQANRLQAGKRPLSSMSPTIMLAGQKPLLTLGAAGGPRIISQVVLTIVRMVDRGMPLQQAVAAPRFHHQWRPDQLFVETRGGSFALPAPRIADLRQLGHTVVPMPYAGATQCVGYSVSGKLIAVTEPRLSNATVSTAKDGR